MERMWMKRHIKVISNDEKVVKIFRSLPSQPPWDIKASIQIETKVHSLEELIGSLKAHEMQMINGWPTYQERKIPTHRSEGKHHHHGINQRSAKARKSYDEELRSLGNYVSILKSYSLMFLIILMLFGQ